MSSDNQSNLEKRFRTTTAYKRSKQYFDINRLNKIEQRQQLSRRKPSQYLNQTHPIKFEESFYSSQLKVKERVQTQLTKCSSKFGREDDQFDNLYSLEKIRRGKTLDMEKMLSRKHYERSLQKQGKTEYHFNNFTPYKLPSKNSIQFEKYYPPCDSIKTKGIKIQLKSCQKCKNREGQMNSIPIITEPEVGKAKEKLIFGQSLFRTLVDFKKHDKEKSERKQEQLEDLDLDRIKLGEMVSQKHANLGLLQFYYGDNKWNTSQMDTRLMKQNEAFLKAYNKLQNKKKDWLTVKRKTDMMEGRISKIVARKHIKDVKGQICDQIYFRRNYL